MISTAALTCAARRAAAFIAALSAACAALGSVPGAENVIDSDQAKFKIEVVAQGIDTPWALEFLPNADLLISQKRGGLYRVRHEDRRMVAIDGLPQDMYVGRQSGMHDIALDPAFARNRYVYLTYTSGTEAENRPVLMRYRLRGDRLVEPRILFKPEVARTGASHSGNRILIHSDGAIWLSVGHVLDYLDREFQAQDLRTPYGSIVRLTREGTIPKDNPFVGRADARAEIFSYGHRNPQGLAQRPGSDQVWSVEHGPKGGDELNLLRKGVNYGWPYASFGTDYDDTPVKGLRAVSGLQAPAWYWRPSIAPSSLAFYDDAAFPNWRGDVFVSSLKGMQLVRFELDGDRVIGTESLLGELQERFREVKMGPDGFLYLLTDHRSGRVLRLIPAQ